MPVAAQLGWGWPLSLSLSPQGSSPRPVCSANARIRRSFLSDTQGPSLKVLSPVSRGTTGHEEGQAQGGRGPAVRSMALAGLQAFFGASAVVSVAAALCMGPTIVPLHLLQPGCRDNKGYLWVRTHTPMQRSTGRPLFNQRHLYSNWIVFKYDEHWFRWTYELKYLKLGRLWVMVMKLCSWFYLYLFQVFCGWKCIIISRIKALSFWLVSCLSLIFYLCSILSVGSLHCSPKSHRNGQMCVSSYMRGSFQTSDA